MPKTPFILGGIFIFCVLIAYWISSSVQENAKNKLPILSPNDVNPELVDKSMQGIGTNHTIRYFSLKNQLGNEITGKELDGKIHVVDFFFTTCGGICPQMTKQLERVQAAFEDDDRIMILSHTVTPERDSVEVLNRYADKHHANPKKWFFLTGDKKEIYGMARKSYFIVKERQDGEDDGSGADFIHTENFVLIDGKKRIRGYYNGIRSGSVDTLITDIKRLLDE